MCNVFLKGRGGGNCDAEGLQGTWDDGDVPPVYGQEVYPQDNPPWPFIFDVVDTKETLKIRLDLTSLLVARSVRYTV